MQVEIALRPFELTVRRAGRRLLRSMGAWVADGTVHDHFIQFTEGVSRGGAGSGRARGRGASAPSGPRPGGDGDRAGRWPARASRGPRARRRSGVASSSRRRAIRCGSRRLAPPLRRALRRSGARHGTQFDQAGGWSSSAPTAATRAPTARPSCLPAAGSRRATARRCPGRLESRLRRLGRGRTRTASGSTSPATACRRRHGRALGRCGWISVRPHAGRPAAGVLPPDRVPGGPARVGLRVLEEPRRLRPPGRRARRLRGLPPHDIPVDAIVLDSPWATQYNTWDFNPYQFPDAPGLIRRMRSDGVRTVVWVTPWVNTDSRDGQIPPHPSPSSSTAGPRRTTPRAWPRALRTAGSGRGRRAVRHSVVDGDGIAGRLHQPRGRGVVARAGQASTRARRRGDQGRRRRGLLHARAGPVRGRSDRRARRRGRWAAFTE